MHLNFGEKFLLSAKFAKKTAKNRPQKMAKKRAHSSPRATSETKNNRNVEIGTNIAHGVRMMPTLCIFSRLYCDDMMT